MLSSQPLLHSPISLPRFLVLNMKLTSPPEHPFFLVLNSLMKTSLLLNLLLLLPRPILAHEKLLSFTDPTSRLKNSGRIPAEFQRNSQLLLKFWKFWQ
jgi:hypothetical protein